MERSSHSTDSRQDEHINGETGLEIGLRAEEGRALGAQVKGYGIHDSARCGRSLE